MRFPDGTQVLDHFDLEISNGELMVLVGPSGSGKTTLLRLIAGLEHPTGGTILFDGEPVQDLLPPQRNVSMVFQDGALFAHMSAGENIGFPLRIRHVERHEAERRIEAGASHVGILTLLDTRPRELSAGHRHAVATARAIIRDSDVFLLDEPLAALDTRARLRIRTEVVRLHLELAATMVYVTNDTSEALAIGERIAVIDDRGRLHQADTPHGIYERPIDTFVAGFMGEVNILETRLETDDEGDWVKVGTDRTRLSAGFVEERPPLQRFRGKPILVGVRPQHLTPAPPGMPFDRCVHGTVQSVDDLGADLHVVVAAGPVTLAARFQRARRLYRGDPVELAVDPQRWLFFDPADERLIA